jgi:tetratricopeptide (TPR) repeat protein
VNGQEGSGLCSIAASPPVLAGTVSALAFAISLAIPPVACAQAANDSINKRVVQRSAGFRLKIDDEPVARSGKAIEFYRIERTEGPLLWLQAEKQRYGGWAKVDDVVPVEQSIAYFTAQINAHPREAFYHAMRAFLRRDKSELDGALKDSDEAIRLDPRSASFYCGRGHIRICRNELEQAIADYTQAIRLDPKWVAAYIGRGDAWRSSRKYDEAIADYSEAIWLDPLAITAYHERGLSWHAKKEYEKAIIDYDLEIRLDPESAPAHTSRGFAWKAKGRYDKACADFKEAVELDPKSPEPLGGQAWIWASCPDARYRDGRKAVASATRACELSGWKRPCCLSALAAASAEISDYNQAIIWQTKANAIESDSSRKAEGEARLALYRENKPFRQTVP